MDYPLLFTLAILAVVCLGTTLFYPTRCVGEGDLLKVHSLARTLTFDLRQATSIEPVRREDIRNLRTFKLFAVGWPLRPFGWFRNRQFGAYLSLVTRLEGMYLIELPGRRLLVSPENVRGLFLPHA
ncbi:MAG: PH domain-containing protein [Acidobacteriaceae bacterium]